MTPYLSEIRKVSPVSPNFHLDIKILIGAVLVSNDFRTPNLIKSDSTSWRLGGIKIANIASGSF